MDLLESVEQHRSIRVIKDIISDHDPQIGPDAHQLPIESAVVQPTQRDSIWDDGRAAFRVTHNMWLFAMKWGLRLG